MLLSEREIFYDFTLSVSMIEIYNEQLRDLLEMEESEHPETSRLPRTGKRLEIRSSGDCVEVSGLSTRVVNDMDTIVDILEKGYRFFFCCYCF